MSSKMNARPQYIATTDARERAIITAQGLDPDRFHVKSMKTWMAANGEARTSWQIELDKRIEADEKEALTVANERRAAEREALKQLNTDNDIAMQFDQAVAASTKIIRQYKPPVYRGLVGHDAMVINTADWQVGKNENGVGTDETIRRIIDCIYQAERWILFMRAMGNVMPKLVILSPGDLVEGCVGFYSNQTYTVDRDRRSQTVIVVQLLTKLLTVLGRHFDEIEVMAVGGNHGENRSGSGKLLTTRHDNDDCLVWDLVKHSFDGQGRTDITWHIAGHELSMAREIAGVHVGLTHGHLFKSGSSAAIKWLQGQQFGREETAGVDLLVTGHFHSLIVHEFSAGRFWIQNPTIDPGSAWFAESSGISSTPGMLIFRLDCQNPSKFDDLKVLVPSQPVVEVAA